MLQLNKRAIISIASIFSLRMYGLFLIIPVFSLYVTTLENADSFLLGVAFGIYGLTQGLMQIPFGALSDKIGRKVMISFGLLLFFIGSLMAYFATSVEAMIIARALQGSGAIAAVSLALLADMTSEKERTIAMAIVGGSIGLMFMLGLITGPMWINVLGGVPEVFLLVALLSVIALILVWTAVPKEPKSDVKISVNMTKNIAQVFKDGFLLRCNIGIFTLHCVLMCLFLVVPIELKKYLNLPSEEHGWVYAYAMTAALVVVLILMRMHHKSQSIELNSNKPLLISIVLMIVGFACLILFKQSYSGYVISLFFFLSGFTMIEALLPSTVSKYADVSFRGAALGMFNSFEFVGIFVGGALGGFLLKTISVDAVYIFCIILLSLWLISLKVKPQIERELKKAE